MIDETRAELVSDFFSQILKMPDGSPFILADWQEALLWELFGRVENGRRQYTTAYWEIPKKNGKSTLLAGIGLYGLLADDPRPHVYLAASCREQALNVFRPAANMVQNSPQLRNRCEVLRSTKTITLNGSHDAFLKVISNDSGTMDGIEPSMTIFDELHRQKTRDLWSILRKGMSTRREPLMCAITTAGIASETPICWEMHEYALAIQNRIKSDRSFFPVIYALGEDEDWTDEANWLKVNPALGDPDKQPDKFKSIRILREDFLQAKDNPGQENEFRRFELNQWVAQEVRWIPLSDWDKGSRPIDLQKLYRQKCYAGLDLSSTLDLSALVLSFPMGDEVWVLPFFWVPEETAEKLNTNVSIKAWAAQGLVHITPGRVVDYRAIRAQINELKNVYNIQEIAHDPWNASQLAVELDGDGFTLVPIRQGFASLSPPSKEFERLVFEQKLIHGGNPVLRWNVDCVSRKQDPAGNIKPSKPDRATTHKRIDGVLGTIMSIDRLSRHREPKYQAFFVGGESS